MNPRRLGDYSWQCPLCRYEYFELTLEHRRKDRHVREYDNSVQRRKRQHPKPQKEKR